MKILIATTELPPLTAPSPLGDLVAMMTTELQHSKDVEVAVALPAFPAILAQNQDRIRDIKVRLPLPHPANPNAEARILEAQLDSAPQVFLVDAEEFRQDEADASHETPIVTAQAFSQAVVEMLARLEPPIHLVHCFGWQSGLTTLLLPARGLACRTAFTPDSRPAWSPGIPTVEQVRQSASRYSLTELTELTAHQSIVDVCRAAADQAIPIDDALSSPSFSDTSAPPHSLLHLSPRPIVFLPATKETSLLGFADRLLIDGASLAIQNALPQPNPALTATVESLRLRYPGQVALLATPASDTLPGPPDSTDILLIFPHEAARPETPGRILEATRQGRIAVVPHGSIQTEDDEKTCFYHTPEPEAIWCALKRALKRYRQTNPGAMASPTHPIPDQAPPHRPSPSTFLYRSYDAYRGLVIKTLADAAA